MYYYLGTNAQPINNTGMVSVYQATNINTCPSSFSTGGGGGVILLPSFMLTTEIDSLNNVYNGLEYNYLSLLDGGDTKELQNQIDNTWPEEVWDLRNTLMAKSPFLSEDVLLSTAGKGVLPDAMLLEILLANPDATRGNGFIEKLRVVTNNTFPEYMINYVISNRDTKTTRTNMIAEMASVKADISLKEDVLKNRNKMRDSSSLADRLSTVQMGNSVSDKIGRLDYYISRKQWTSANDLLHNLQNNDTLKDQLSLINHFGDYIDFRKNLGGRTLAQLDSSEVSYLQTLAENKGRVAGYAQNILCFFYHKCYKDTFPVEGDGAENQNTTSDSSLNEVLYNLALSPNPATSSTTISWTIYDQLNNCSYKVLSLKDGSVAAQGSITQNEGSATITASNLPGGYYVVKIINNGTEKTQKKLVVE